MALLTFFGTPARQSPHPLRFACITAEKHEELHAQPQHRKWVRGRTSAPGLATAACRDDAQLYLLFRRPLQHTINNQPFSIPVPSLFP